MVTHMESLPLNVKKFLRIKYMKDTIKEILALNKTKEKLVSKLKKEFDNKIKDLFKKYPEVDRIAIPINNHEYNDGDDTSFEVYACDMIAFDKNEDEIDSKHAIYAEIINLFELTEIDNIHESWYSKEYGDIEMCRKTTLKG